MPEIQIDPDLDQLLKEFANDHPQLYAIYTGPNIEDEVMIVHYFLLSDGSEDYYVMNQLSVLYQELTKEGYIFNPQLIAMGREEVCHCGFLDECVYDQKREQLGD